MAESSLGFGKNKAREMFVTFRGIAEPPIMHITQFLE